MAWSTLSFRFPSAAYALPFALLCASAPRAELTASTLATSATTTTSNLSASTTSVTPRRLLTIRVRPVGEALRVILSLDGPAPYTVRNGAPGQAFVDLLNVKADYLPPELAQLHDPRLQGIWLAVRQPGLTTLELRLPGSAIHIEHFALTDPPAIVLDLTRTDQSVANLQITPRNFDLQPNPPAGMPPLNPAAAPPVEIAMQKSGSALPVAWLDSTPTPEPHAATQDVFPTADATTPSLNQKSSEPIQLLPAANVQATTATLNTTPTPDEPETHPINRDFDDFPIDSLELAGPNAKAIRQEFLNRQWPGVISDGLDYLKEKRLNKDAVAVLYMIAEARYQLGHAQATPPLGDMLNFYQQAQRTDDSGELGAFAGMRLSNMLLSTGDAGGALAMAEKGLTSTDPHIHQRAAIQVARAQAAGGQPDRALATLASLQSAPGVSADDQLKLKLFEAGIRQSQNDAPGAWKAYQEATQLDPSWTSRDSPAGEQMARAALAAGHPAEARMEIEYLNRMFSFSDDSEKVSLALLYAQTLEALGDTRTAEETYAVLLNGLGDTAKGREVQKLMARLHPDDLIASQGRYARLLFRQGKLRDAMGELHRSYQQALHDGIDTASLDDAAGMIIPSFMRDAVAHKNAFDAVQAWRFYSDKLHRPAERAACQQPLGTALAALGLDTEAQRVVDELATQGKPNADLQRLEAKLCLDRAAPDAALALLKPLASDPADHDSAATLRLLAQASEQANQKLEAAQAWQALARQRGVLAEERGASLLKAGNLFLDQGMPQQTQQLGLNALLDEKDQLKDETHKPWSAALGNDLVLMLARSFIAQGDAARAQLVLQELLARPWQNPDQTAQARWLLAQAEHNQGNAQLALQTLKTLDVDTQTPELWRIAAQTARAVSNWNTQHPHWAIDPNSPSPPATQTASQN